MNISQGNCCCFESLESNNLGNAQCSIFRSSHLFPLNHSTISLRRSVTVHLCTLQLEVVASDSLWNIFSEFKTNLEQQLLFVFWISQGLCWTMKLKCFCRFSADNFIFDLYFLSWISNILLSLSVWKVFF